MSPEMATLLQQHLTGSAPAADTIASLVGDDPELAAIAQLLSQREQQLEADLREQELEFEPPVSSNDDRFERLSAQVEELAANLAHLQNTLDLVSSALGACPSCLGADATCPLCHGRGRPGSLPPEPSAFDVVVMPAVRAHAFTRSRNPREFDQETVKETPGRSTS